MADHNTRSKSMDHLEEIVKFLSFNQSKLSTKFDFILSQLSSLIVTTSSTSNSNQHKPYMKLDVPCFNGIDAMRWIFKISQFFDYHGTPQFERLSIASFYMEWSTLS